MSMMAMQMGLGAIRGLTNYGLSSVQSKMNSAVQDYKNSISAMAAAQAMNVTTANEIQAQDAVTRAKVDIQQRLLIAEGQARVSAGAAGVKGGSVDGVMRGLKSAAARADHATQKTFDMQMNAFGQERRNTLVSKALNRDVTVIPQPSVSAALLGVGQNMLEVWDTHQTPNETVAARLGDTQGSVVRT